VQKKVDSVRFTNGNPTLYYTYDAQGNRLSKRTNPDFANYYVRDAQGNALATYSLKQDSLYLIEQNLYGSARLGVKNLAILAQIDTQRQQLSDTLRIFEERVGAKNYELSNHLGNVLATISDKTIFNTDHYNGIVYSAQLYYPFGWEIPTLSYAAKKYRFGFNGKEDDREWHAQDYGFRLYTPRESRFISVDPITAEYPELTPYQFASNRPIDGIDLDGLEWSSSIWDTPLGWEIGKAVLPWGEQKSLGYMQNHSTAEEKMSYLNSFVLELAMRYGLARLDVTGFGGACLPKITVRAFKPSPVAIKASQSIFKSKQLAKVSKNTTTTVTPVRTATLPTYILRDAQGKTLDIR
jgi:RHS repeat-associated protein